MSNFMTRAITGIVFVLVVLGAVLWRIEAFKVLIMLISAVSLFEFLRLYKDRDNSVNPYFGAISGGIVLLLYSFFRLEMNVAAFFLLIIVPLCLVLNQLFTYKKDIFSSAGLLLAGNFYFVYPFAMLLTFLENYNGDYKPEIFIYLLVIVWCNDTFAYLGGKLLGKHKLMPKVSPNKTVEGFVSGLVFAGIASFLMCYFGMFQVQIPWYKHIIIGVFFGTAATIGDLIQSSVKRMAGAKDSGNIFPGHGGMWDRFDGLIAVVWVYILSSPFFM